MTSEKRAQKFHTDDVSLPRFASDVFFFSTNQKHYLDLGGDGSSVWNFCARFNTESCSVTKRDDYVIMLNEKEMCSNNQPGEKKKTLFRKMIQKTG